MEILRRYITLGFLLCLGNIFGQQHPVDIIYSHLDQFLAEANPENLNKLKLSINRISEATNEIQLAKTIAYCNIGYVQSQNDKLQLAINWYEKAKQLYFSADLDNYNIIEYCLKPLGNLYIKTQAYSEAENTIKHYILFAQKTEQRQQEIGGFLNLSVLYHNRGEFEKSKIILMKALERSPANQDLKLNLASTFFALNEKDETKKILKNILTNTSNNIGAIQLLAQVQLADEEYSVAILNLQKAIELLQNKLDINFRDVAKLHLSLAETYLAAEQFPNSLLEIQKVYASLIPSYKNNQQIPDVQQLYAETTLLDALDIQAKLFSKEQKTKKALHAFELASKVNDFLFAELYMQDSKLIVQQSAKRRYELIMELLYQEYQASKNIKWIEKAINIDSKVKGRVVADAVNLKSFLDLNDENKAKKFQKLQKQLFSLGNEIQKMTNEEFFDLDTLVVLQKSYSQMLTQQRILYDSLQLELHSEISHKNLKVEELKAKTKRLNQTLISYFMGTENMYQIIISEEKVAFNKLTNSEEEFKNFRESIRNYNRFFESPAIINNDISSFIEASNTLYNYLNIPKSKHFIIIPDGILSFIPFQTLITETTESRDYSQMPFLLFNSSVSYLLSIKSYLKIDDTFQKKQSILGVFPIFKNTSQELSYSVLEADVIEKLFPSNILKGKNATRKTFLTERNKYSILHISTHALGGTFNEDASIKFYDKTLNIEEIYGLDFKAQLVVLSACDTGVGKFIKGEGALSLARAFQYSGAENLLFSLWQVNDKSTAELMINYYKNLKQTQSRNVSLQNASLNYLQDKTINNSQKSPYYWGAFVYYGATDIPIQSGSYLWYIIGIGAFVLVLLILFFKKSKSRISKIKAA